ncbi:hypothetical protein ACUXS2_001451 [Ralstonia sp. 130770013-1]|jgi:hypothetical protein
MLTGFDAPKAVRGQEWCVLSQPFFRLLSADYDQMTRAAAWGVKGR